jgi:hypothetical protein
MPPQQKNVTPKTASSGHRTPPTPLTLFGSLQKEFEQGAVGATTIEINWRVFYENDLITKISILQRWPSQSNF